MRWTALALAIAVILTATPAAAAIAFSGTIQNTTPPGAPGGRCGPPPVLTLSFAPETTTGTSNFGNFAVTASHCVVPTPPVTNYNGGLFSFAFQNGSTLFGTYTGTFSIIPGQPASSVQNYIVEGGTGQFANHAGTFQHVGTIVFGPGGTTSGSSTLQGSLHPVPEPSTWATMLIGFGAIGAAVRRGKRRAIHSKAAPAPA